MKSNLVVNTCALFLSLVFIASPATAQPVPELSIATSNPLLLSDTVIIELSLENGSTVADETGFYPLIELTLPDGIECDATCRSNIAVTSLPGAPITVNHFGGFGQSSANHTNPITDESITLGDDESLLVIAPPLGSIAVGQPAITISIPATLTSDAVVGAAETINGRGIFALGDAANGNISECGGSGDTICAAAVAPADVTPSVAILRTTVTDDVAAATGPHYPRTFTTTVDVATGATITGVTVADIIPDEIVVINPPDDTCDGSGDFTVSGSPATCGYTGDPNGGASFSVLYASITGGNGDDITITYKGYVQEHVNGSGSDVVDASSGVDTTSQNSATFNFDYLGNPQTQQTAQATISQKSNDVIKNAAITNDQQAAGNSPGDVIAWTTTIYISDYFSFDNLDIDDDIADGQTYETSSMTVQIVEDTTDVTRGEGDLTPGSYLTGLTKDGNGVTHFDLDLSGALDNNVFPGLDSTLEGSAAFATPTRVVIEYRTTIDDQFVATLSGDNTQIIDGGDVIGNSVDVNFLVVGSGSDPRSNVSNSITIVPLPSVTKVVEFECNASMTCGAPSDPLEVSPAESLVYKITATIPTGDLENFSITDYLPTPFFDATDPDANGSQVEPGAFSQVAQGDTAPENPGEWRYTNNSDVTPAVTVSVNRNDNTLKFDFSDAIEDTGASAQRKIEILFAIKATAAPMHNDLKLVNVIVAQHANSAQETAIVTEADAIQLITQEPEISITKTADSILSGNGDFPGGNFSGVDVGDQLRFSVTLENTGDSTAYEIQLVDTLPAASGLQRSPGGLNLGGTCVALFPANDSFGDQVFLGSGTLASGASCTLTYDAQVVAPARFGDVITNTASVSWAGEPSGARYPTQTDSATTTIANPVVTKAFQNGSSSDANTSDPDVRPGETAVFQIQVSIPEGQASSVSIGDLDLSSGDLEGDFLQPLSQASVTFGANVEQNCSLGGDYSGYYNFVGNTTLCFENDLTQAGFFTQSSSTLFSIDFGNMINGDTDDSTPEVITMSVTVSPNADKPNGTYTNRARIYYTNASGQRNVTGTGTFDIESPVLTISKTSLTAAPVSIGDTLRYVIDVENTGIVTAYSVADIADTLPAGVISPTLVSATYEGTNVIGSVSIGGTVPNITFPVVDEFSNPEIDQNANFVVTFDTTVGGTMVADSTDGPGHPGGVVDGPGCVNSITNSADIASFKTGPLAGDPTATEVAVNTQSHTLDSDGDGVLNSVETAGGCPDSDGDGVDDYLDTDSDDNGVPDSTEYDGGKDTDGDGTPDFIDDDDDNDGTSDWDEITDAGGDPTDDTDGDTIPDWQDEDSDNDGIPDATECGGTDPCPDADGDGLENYRDLDSDNDGIPDIVESGGVDSDGNGIADDLTDDDGDGLPDLYDGDDNRTTGGAADPLGTALNPPDTDSDSFVDYLDIDADNDGIVDNVEAQAEGSYVAPSGTDANGNGLDDIYEGAGALTQTDTDSDSTFDVLDDDSDNDGVPDAIEGHDTNADGVADRVIGKTTNVVFSGNLDAGSSLGTGDPFDFAGTSSNIGHDPSMVSFAPIVINAAYSTYFNVFDSLGAAHSVYVYFFQSGVANEWEVGFYIDGGEVGGVSGQPYRLGGMSAADLSYGQAGVLSFGGGGTRSSVGSPDLTLGPINWVGAADMSTIDVTLNPYTQFATPSSVSNLVVSAGAGGNGDFDSDGLIDKYDTFDLERSIGSGRNEVGSNSPLPNHDSDSLRDWRDTDDDGDGILTEDEDPDTDNNPTNDDTDGDGTPNYLDPDSDGDSRSDDTECNSGSCPDTDGDTFTDQIDLDSDSDGIPDSVEGGGDFDGDGIENYRDLDSDGDGIYDIIEAGGVDTDGDGLLDDTTDTDSDGLADLVDGTPLPTPDTDGDGKPDYLDIDADNDGIVDTIEALPEGTSPAFNDTDANSNGMDDAYEGVNAIAPVNLDGDSLPDYRDLDTDGDGVGDLIEGHDDDADGVADVSPSGNDADNDGLDDAFDTEDAASASDSENALGTNAPLPDFDSDNNRDWRDTDDDNDGISTETEGEGDPDEDNKPNYKDLDSDNDGESDEDEGTGDIDNDGTPDYLDPPTCTMSGKVQLPSGEGLSDVTVTLTPGSYRAVTDADGNYSIEEIEDGSYTLEAQLKEGSSIAEQAVAANNGDCGDVLTLNANWNLVSPVYFVWNGFVRQLNLVVLSNKGDERIRATVTLYNIQGGELHTERHWLESKTEKDLIINDMPGYAVDTYGFVKVEFDPETGFDGGSVHYRLGPDGEKVEFGIIRPFESVRRGNTFALFNQINPSLDPEQANNEMPSWAQVVNLNGANWKLFTVRLYDTQGTVISSSRMGVPPMGRRDVNGGHQSPGIGGVGLIEIIPDDQLSPYAAQLYHYSSDGPVAYFAPTYSYAIGDHFRPGVNYSQYAPISNGAEGTNWVVLVNTDDSAAEVQLDFIRNTGDDLGSQTVTVSAKSQVHLNASSLVDEPFSGVVRAKSLNGRKVIVKSFVYFHGDFGWVSAAYGTPGRGVFGGTQSVGFNSFWSQQSWLKVFNTGDSRALLTIKVYGSDGTLYGQAELSLPSMRGRDIDVRSGLGIDVPDNEYGTVVVESDRSGAIFAELLRVKPGSSDALIDLAKGLPVR